MKKRVTFILFLLMTVILCGSFDASAKDNSYAVKCEQLINGIIEYNLDSAGKADVNTWIVDGLTADIGGTAEWYMLGLIQHSFALEADGININKSIGKYRKALESYVEENDIRGASARLKFALLLDASGSDSPYIREVLNDGSIGGQGIMSYVFGLHLLNNGYESDIVTVEMLLNKLEELQHADGGWSLSGGYGDVDVTAMTLTALAPNKEFGSINAGGSTGETVEGIISKGVQFLSDKQLEDGDYQSYGARNAESTAQVITALSSLGIDCAKDKRFRKNGNDPIDGLTLYRQNDGSFAHKTGDVSNATATVQAFYSLVAYDRMLNGKGQLYIFHSADNEGKKADSVDADALDSENDIADNGSDVSVNANDIAGNGADASENANDTTGSDTNGDDVDALESNTDGCDIDISDNDTDVDDDGILDGEDDITSNGEEVSDNESNIAGNKDYVTESKEPDSSNITDESDSYSKEKEDDSDTPDSGITEQSENEDTGFSDTVDEGYNPEQKVDVEAAVKEGNTPAVDQKAAEKENSKNSHSYKFYAIIAILAVCAIVCAILAALKKHWKNIVFTMLVTALAIVFVVFTRFSTTQDYYGSTDNDSTDTGLIAQTDKYEAIESAVAESAAKNADATVNEKHVSMSIRCDIVKDRIDSKYIPKDGCILDMTVYNIADGDTAYDVLIKAAKENGISIDHKGSGELVYISGISYLYELDYGDLSGWVYKVNGELPPVGCAAYKLADGDVIEWCYTLDLGNDTFN